MLKWITTDVGHIDAAPLIKGKDLIISHIAVGTTFFSLSEI